jgi:hypothetical protein
MGESNRRGSTELRTTKAKRRSRLKWMIPLGIVLVAGLVVGIWYFGGLGADKDEKASTEDHSKHDHGDSKKDDEVKKPEQPTIVKPYWRLTKSPPVTTEPVGLNFRFADHKTEEVITDYELYHEKKMHTIVVSKDLRDFYHYHPEMATDGLFNVNMDLKRATTYKIFVDARSKSQGWINEYAEVIVRKPEVVANHKDPKTAPPAPPLDPPNLVVNDKQTITLEGKKISLSATDLKVGKEANLTFTFKDAASGADITDLQPYLGAVGHVILVSEDASEYIHTHPIDDKQRGPKASFSAIFEKEGKYKLWGEFQHQGKRIVVPYVIDVKK